MVTIKPIAPTILINAIKNVCKLPLVGISGTAKKYKNVYMVHGHTPTIAMFRFNFNGIENCSKQEMSKNPTILRYADGHKINIDLGCFATNKTCLLNLDTLEPIYFTQEIESDIEYIYE